MIRVSSGKKLKSHLYTIFVLIYFVYYKNYCARIRKKNSKNNTLNK